MKWFDIMAVSSWFLFAYMMPVVAIIVMRRRRADPTEVILDDEL